MERKSLVRVETCLNTIQATGVQLLLKSKRFLIDNFAFINLSAL